MRRFLVIGALALLALPASSSAASRTVGDGTLSIVNGSGVIQIVAHGSLIGQIGRGRLTIETLTPSEGALPIVSGFERARDLSETKAFYSGSDVRFRVIGGYFRLRLVGSGINLSLVGRGSATVSGTGTFDDGGISTDDGDTYRPLPLFPTVLQIGTAAATPTSAP